MNSTRICAGSVSRKPSFAPSSGSTDAALEACMSPSEIVAVTALIA
ncbi:hypothetical protein [Mesorhizobium sp. LSJC280B00]|nr:hypothetical protein [Mesorhizobium sp. LSJC280B00]